MLLKRGDNNEDVKKLQAKLGLEPIGNFGPKTEDAVKAWQAKNGLTADGIVGPNTWNKIMGITQVPKPVAQPTAPAPQPVASAPVASVAGLNLAKLKGHIPDNVIAMIPDTAAKFGINTPLRLAHFLAQCGHESGGFRATQENLNYSAKGLKSFLNCWDVLARDRSTLDCIHKFKSFACIIRRHPEPDMTILTTTAGLLNELTLNLN